MPVYTQNSKYIQGLCFTPLPHTNIGQTMICLIIPKNVDHHHMTISFDPKNLSGHVDSCTDIDGTIN